MNCENCRIGHFQPISTPYLHWLGEHILLIPDAPAELCDICGEMRYDDGFINNLQFLLDRFAGEDPDSYPVVHRPTWAESAGWQPPRRSR